MLSHNAKYYSKSITTSKLKSKSIHQFFTPGGTSSDKEQLSIHKIDVKKKKKMFCNTFCKRNFISPSVFTPNPSHIFTFVFEEKENMKTNFNLKRNLPVPML